MNSKNTDLTPEELEKLKAIELILNEKEDLTDEEIESLQSFFKNI
jgi:hypothetical protein